MLRFATLICVALAGAAAAQTTLSELLENKTLAELRRFDEGFDGALGVAAIDLTTGHTFALHGNTVFPQASVIKIAILARMYQAAGDSARALPLFRKAITLADLLATPNNDFCERMYRPRISSSDSPTVQKVCGMM